MPNLLNTQDINEIRASIDIAKEEELDSVWSKIKKRLRSHKMDTLYLEEDGEKHSFLTYACVVNPSVIEAIIPKFADEGGIIQKYVKQMLSAPTSKGRTPLQILLQRRDSIYPAKALEHIYKLISLHHIPLSLDEIRDVARLLLEHNNIEPSSQRNAHQICMNILVDNFELAKQVADETGFERLGAILISALKERIDGIRTESAAIAIEYNKIRDKFDGKGEELQSEIAKLERMIKAQISENDPDPDLHFEKLLTIYKRFLSGESITPDEDRLLNADINTITEEYPTATHNGPLKEKLQNDVKEYRRAQDLYKTYESLRRQLAYYEKLLPTTSRARANSKLHM